MYFVRTLFLLLVILPVSLVSAQYPGAQPQPQQQQQPMSSNEFVSRLYQLPRYPDKRNELVEEIRKRGIGFPLTDGMRGLVATKSGNDALLRRTLEEAERRRVNPAASALPPALEGDELLVRTRNVTLAAANAMPDFIVKQIIRRYYAYGSTSNWMPQDTLSIAVGYRANQGEQYKLLSINGIAPAESQQGDDISKVAGGTTSQGVEYISALADLFKPSSQTEFRMVDTDVIQTRRTIVYEYTVKRENSTLSLKEGVTNASAVVGSQGRLWIDRELDRVVRFEQIASEIPAGFPITAASSTIEYSWVDINERKYLLPFHSEILMTEVNPKMVVQSRNDVRFRNYQKYGAELKVVDEVGEDDEPTNAAPPTNTVPPTTQPKADKPVRTAPALPKPAADKPVDDAPPPPKLKPIKPPL